MLNPISDSKVNSIVRNVLAACKDIKKLNKVGYNYLYLASGFIAHYNIHGFKDYYQDHSLRQDILQNAGANTWKNFRPGDQNYEYYHQKGEIYKRIVEDLRK